MTSESWDIKRNPEQSQSNDGQLAVYLYDNMSEKLRMLTIVGDIPEGALPEGVTMNELVGAINQLFIPFVKCETKPDQENMLAAMLAYYTSQTDTYKHSKMITGGNRRIHLILVKHICRKTNDIILRPAIINSPEPIIDLKNIMMQIKIMKEMDKAANPEWFIMS